MKRALILVVPLALALVACGGDDDDEPTDTIDISIPENLTIPDDISIPDLSIPDLSIPDISFPDLTLPDISIPDISIPDLSIPENANELIGGMFPGLDDEQIDCLVDAAEEVGGQPADPSQLLDFLRECNIEMADLQPG